MAQSVKSLTFGFGSGRDLLVCGMEPRVRLCAGSLEPAWDSLSPSFSAPPCLSLFLSHTHKINKTFLKPVKKKKKKKSNLRNPIMSSVSSH